MQITKSVFKNNTRSICFDVLFIDISIRIDYLRKYIDTDKILSFINKFLIISFLFYIKMLFIDLQKKKGEHNSLMKKKRKLTLISNEKKTITTTTKTNKQTIHNE